MLQNPQMSDHGPLLYTLFSNFPFSSSKIAYTLPRPTVYTPLYKKPFAILKITYIRQAPKMSDHSPSRVYAFLKDLLPFLKIAYTRFARVYAPTKKLLRHLENSVCTP